MKVLNIIWWLIYTCAAIFLQIYTIGVDFFIPGIIVALQEKKIWQTSIVLGSFICIQEGMGTMPFGKVFLWYALTIIFFYAWRWFFEVESLMFILLLSLALSVSHYFIVTVLASVQDIYINYNALRDECVYQMLLTPVIWHAISYLRKGFRNAEQD